MTITETLHAKGQVKPSFVNLHSGECIPWEFRHNTLSYDAAEAMAAAFGGDSTLIPNRIGIVYGGSEDIDSAEISRSQSWTSFRDELMAAKADVQIQSFNISPSIKSITRELPTGEKESGVAVTFHAHSDSTTEGYFKILGSGAKALFTSGKKILQAVLLNQGVTGDPTILARVSLADTSSGNKGYKTKPDNFELALEWTVKFF